MKEIVKYPYKRQLISGTEFMEVLEVESIKSEPAWDSSLSDYVPPEDLYADHKVKQELVIGPELLQQEQQLAPRAIEVTVKIENGDTCSEELRNCNVKPDTEKMKHYLSHKDLFNIQNCFVKIERMTLHKEQYICKTCGESFSRRSIRTYHIMRCHRKIQTTSKSEISKGTINIKKKTRIQINENKTSLKNDTAKPHKCDVCRKQFKLRSQLINHERTHTGEKPYSCKICSKAFSELSNLRKHERSHTGERPFSCKICKRQFAMKCNLLDHIRIHTNERPYSCDVCFNEFRDSTGLTRHKLIHAKDKQFTCDICNRRFTRKYRLVNHIRTHTTKKSNACKICPKEFGKKSSLRALEKQQKVIHLCEICDKQFSQLTALKRHLLSHMAAPALEKVS